MTKILIMEDDELNRDMLSQRLELRGYDVFEAVDAFEGLHIARSETPDLILMDIELPERDGWEATRRLKSGSDTSQIPILALTAHAMASHREKALRAGCDDYDTKPVDLRRLLGKIEAILTLEMRT